MTIDNIRFQTDELLNCMTHGFGVVLSIAGLVTLVALACKNGSGLHVMSSAIFGGALVLLYTASTLYHAARSPRAKKIFKTLDHSCIYLLIAGTYTPFTLVTLRGTWGWTLFGTVWVLSLFGIIFKLFFVYRFKILSTIVYLAMGWLAIVAIKPLTSALSTGGLLWMAAGGFFYSFGVVFYLGKKIPFHHSIWHMFVLGGSICHFVAILLYVLPPLS